MMISAVIFDVDGTVAEMEEWTDHGRGARKSRLGKVQDPKRSPAFSAAPHGLMWIRTHG